MAGTVINEGGIVYKTLYNTIKDFGLDIEKKTFYKWNGCNKYEVLNHYLHNNFKNNNNLLETQQENFSTLQAQLLQNFDNRLKENYFQNNNISLIDTNLPDIFSNLRKKNIKVCLNTGYNKDIQKKIIDKFNLGELIDDYISSEDVIKGRPYPYMIEELMYRNNIGSSHEVIKIGDTVNDILEGKNANCLLSIGVLTGADGYNNLYEAGADHIIDNFNDLEI